MNYEKTLLAITAAGLTLKASKTKDALTIVRPERLTPELVVARSIRLRSYGLAERRTCPPCE